MSSARGLSEAAFRIKLNCGDIRVSYAIPARFCLRPSAERQQFTASPPQFAVIASSAPGAAR
jgi:hypothetical protein